MFPVNDPITAVQVQINRNMVLHVLILEQSLSMDLILHNTQILTWH